MNFASKCMTFVVIIAVYYSSYSYGCNILCEKQRKWLAKSNKSPHGQDHGENHSLAGQLCRTDLACQSDRLVLLN